MQQMTEAVSNELFSSAFRVKDKYVMRQWLLVHLLLHHYIIQDRPIKIIFLFNIVTIIILFVWFFTSHQQSFSYKGTGLPGLNQY